MPIYEYRCESCEAIQEVMQSISAEPLTTCPDCGGPLRKLISRSAFHLKGSGWYSDHYGLKSPGAKQGSSAASAAGGSSGSGTSPDAGAGAKSTGTSSGADAGAKGADAGAKGADAGAKSKGTSDAAA
jgi:putative FmdB family regulatory protein